MSASPKLSRDRSNYKFMPLLLLLTILLTSNWLFSELLVFFPLSIFDFLKSIVFWIAIILVLAIFSWFFGD
jgi:hypothetical protein